MFGFLLFALTYRVGAAVVAGAVLKPQFLVPVLWLARERRWRSLIIGVAVVAAAALIALLGRGRNGLARLGLASVVASPTLYLHGLTLLLPGTLALAPDVLWFVLALGPWIGSGVSAWIGVVVVAVALVARPMDDLSIPELRESEADLHPAGSVGTVWP